MVAPVRYTSQKQQERISRRQLCERLDEFGWIATPPDEDLGEDFIVHIYLQRRATGVTFHLQLKSVTTLSERRKDDFLVYDFEVKELKHWEAFSLPVVLMVWDVELREGRWALIDEVISDLDRRRPNWRNNKSKASVYIPWSNTTDDASLVKLKQSIGWRLYPNIAKGKSLEMQIKLNFPDSEDGKTAGQAFERFHKKGEPVTFKGRIIQELKFSEWWGQWFGEFNPDNVKITLSPRLSSKIIPIDLYMISSDRIMVSYPNIELRVIKAGTEVIELSNEQQDAPLRFRFNICNPENCKEINMSYKLNNLGGNVHETRNIMGFLQSITSGGILRLAYKDYFIETNVPPHPEKAPPRKLLQFIDKLCTIQAETSQFLQMPDGQLTSEDVRATNELIAIIEHGKTITTYPDITMELQSENIKVILGGYRQRKPITHIILPFAESYVELFGQKIQTGRMTRYITGIPQISVTELEEVITTLVPTEYLPVKFVDVEIAEIFPDWFIREAQRLSQLLAEKFEVEAVYLFGSLVWSDVHTPETDIDLAVSGLPEERFLEAISYLERESKFPIDLIDLGKASDHLRQRILVEGKLLYEREPVAAFS